MACFIVPATEAIVSTMITKAVKTKEKKHNVTPVSTEADKKVKIPFSRKLKWLNNMLWGGSALLAFEHIWHGEITPLFPFLTAAANSSDTAEMLHEISTVGVAMSVLVSAVWAVMIAVSYVLEKHPQQTVQPDRGNAQ